MFASFLPHPFATHLIASTYRSDTCSMLSTCNSGCRQYAVQTVLKQRPRQFVYNGI